MAIQQSIQIDIIIQGDGAATTFTYAFNRLFSMISDAAGPASFNLNTIPSSANVVGNPSLPACVASIDSFGNLVLTFTSAPGNGQVGTLSVQLLFNSGTFSGVNASWTSATTLNTTLLLALNGTTTVLVPLITSGTITGGAVQFQASADGVNWIGLLGTLPASSQTVAQWNLTAGNTAILFNVGGYTQFRVILTTVITGTGTLTPTIQSVVSPVTTLVTAGVNATYNSSAPSTSAGSQTPLQIDAFGNLLVGNYRRSQVVIGAGNIASTTAATLVAAQGAGVFADLAGLVLTCRLGSTAPILFGILVSDGTTTYRFNLSSESTSTGGGNPPFTVSFEPPIPATNANVAWTIALSSATDSPSVDFVATFVKQKAA